MFKIHLLTFMLTIVVLSIKADTIDMSFNASWLFFNGQAEGAEKINYDDANWRSLDLPHDWAIEGPFDIKYNARCGGLPFHGTGWYRKYFKLSDSVKGKYISLHFDGAMYNAEVWLNGNYIGGRPNGYVGFTVDLTPHLKFGAENLIAVRLTPEDLSSRWYPGAGIYRNTWLHIKSPIHVPQWGTFITSPLVTADSASVNIKTEIRNVNSNTEEVRVRNSVYTQQGIFVDKTETDVVLKALSTTLVEHEMLVMQPILWELNNPHLYKVVTEVIGKHDKYDTYETDFGIRSIEFSPQKGFLLNGQLTRFQGVCLHHDLGALGAAVNLRATERQLEIMKSMGANAIRTSHNPPSPEQVALCDRMGILVQVESFDVWRKAKVENGYNKFFDEWHERDLRDMIRTFRNSPSVVMWSVGNEILEQNDPVAGKEITRRLVEICREEDATRPTTAGFNLYPQPIKNGMAGEIGLVGWNYKPRRYDAVIKQYPDWIVYGSETTGIASSRGVYHLPIEKYDLHPSLQITSYDIIGPPWAYPPDIEFEAIDSNPTVLGEFVWTGFDYLGEPTPFGGRDNSTNGYWNGHWPARSSYFGIVDLCGLPKDRFYLYQSQWTKEPMVHLLPHWNWEGHEGQLIPVFAYTNCDEVELFVNGKSFGKKIKGVDKTTLPINFIDWMGGRYTGTYDSPYRLSWNVPYEHGEIKVVAYKAGKPMLSKQIFTAGQPAKIELIPDRNVINANGQDLSFITVRILDENGNLCPRADNLVHFKVKGEGIIAAVDNGNAASVESFQANFRKAFSGQCMLIVKSNTNSGEISVVAESDNLTSAKATIHTKM